MFKVFKKYYISIVGLYVTIKIKARTITEEKRSELVSTVSNKKIRKN